MAEVTLNTLERNNDPAIWVLNATKGDTRSVVVLTIPKLTGGGEDKVEIPVTSIPINLTNQVPKKQLMAATNFRRSVSHGLLKLLDTEEAEKLLTTPGAQKELERLTKETDAFINNMGRQQVSVTNTDNIRPRLQNLAMAMETSDEDETIHTLNAVGELNDDEKDFLIAKATELKQNSVISHLKS